MTRRSITEIKARHFRAWRGTLTHVMSPDEAKVWAATSTKAQCLTHLVRFVSVYGLNQRPCYHMQCGNQILHAVPVDTRDETFACAKCVANAEKYGEPTFGMIPTTGCEVSEGKRRGRRPTMEEQT